MKKHLPIFIAALAIIVLLFSCQKEVSQGSVPALPLVNSVNAKISGRIIDENGIPVQGATVKAGTATTNTNINGHFSFHNVKLDKSTGFVKAEKQGYFLGSRTFIARENSDQFVDIKLIPKKISGTFKAASGGIIKVANGGEVKFEGDCIINKTSGTAYSGLVSVSAHFINPEAQDFAAIMPGNLLGLTTNNEQRSLESYGMLAVELRSSGGELLNLAPGKTATLQFPIPASLLSKAPKTIPLWFFDEENGIWKEEGSATKQGNNYEGKVSHFSFWNADVPLPMVELTLKVQDVNGQPVPKAFIYITSSIDNFFTSGSGYTDALGIASGIVPSNKPLRMEISNNCGIVMFTKNIGPFSVKTDLGTIVINNAIYDFSLNGQVNDCNNAPVAKGFVHVDINGKSHRSEVINGLYSIKLPSCTNPAKAVITATDINNNKVSFPQTVTLSGSTAINTNIQLCSQTQTEFIQFSVDNVTNTLVSPGDSLWTWIGNSVHGRRITATEIKEIDFGFNGTRIGSYPIQNLNITINAINYKLYGNVNVNITEDIVLGVGAYTIGNFSGKFIDRVSPDSIRVSASFRVRNW